MSTTAAGRARALIVVCALGALAVPARSVGVQPAGDVLPSWTADAASRRRLIEFVDGVTREGSPQFVAPGERIAVFDNDGTLWAEQPTYAQAAFTFDRLRALAPRHPEWKTTPPFSAAMAGDHAAVAAAGEAGLLQLLAATHAGMTTDEFADIVRRWTEEARHPVTGRPYTEMVYQPMLELLAWLRTRGFQTYIVSGGGVEFLRPWTERVYGIPPQQVIGSRIVVRYDEQGGTPVLRREPRADLIDDHAGKPVGIHQVIGRAPILAVGNSDGDYEMLRWTTRNDGPRLGVIVHHTDAKREWAYDKNSPVGRLERALAEAPARGWVVVDMLRDWEVIYPAGLR